MNEEMEALQKNSTWELVVLSTEKKGDCVLMGIHC